MFDRARRFTVFALAAAGALLAACGDAKPAAPSHPNVKIDPVLVDVVLGDPNAPVKIVEYGSFSCPHCRDFWIQQMPKLKPQYIDAGKANYVFHDLPLAGGGAIDQAAGAIVRCAGQAKYFAVVQDLFEHQYDIQLAAQSGDAGQALVAVGERAGLSRDQMLACIDSPEISDYMQKKIKETPASVKGYPTVFINGEIITSSNPSRELTAEDIARVIDAKLGAAPAATPAAAASTVAP